MNRRAPFLLEEFAECQLFMPSSFKYKVEAYPQGWNSMELAYWEELFREYGEYPTWHEMVMINKGKKFTDEEYYFYLQFWYTNAEEIRENRLIQFHSYDDFAFWIFFDSLSTLYKCYPCAQRELEPLLDLYQEGDMVDVSQMVAAMKEELNDELMMNVDWLYRYHTTIVDNPNFTIARYYEDLMSREIF